MITLMALSALADSPPVRLEPEAVGPVAHSQDQRSQDEAVRQLVLDYYDFVWRSLRRLGVPPGDIDDALQQVFMVATKRLPSIMPGSERSFLFSTLVRVASIARRTASRRREAIDPEYLAELTDQGPNPAEMLEYRRARELLDLVLDEMDMDLRSVFVLYEIEELTVPEIAKLVEVPVGTVASRLRRARETFQEALKRYRARRNFKGGVE
jgi:RNA polymerase sigma-70 factor, ECF subfamily